MKTEDVEPAITLLSKWNMAPLKPSPANPNPERNSIIIENSFVSLDGDKVIGVCSYIVLSKETAETASLAVDPAYKGRGIGYKLQAARLKELKKKGIRVVRTETDRPETIRWYTENFDYRVVGTNKKKHSFSLPDVDHWTVLELDLINYAI
ncbi:MAG: GNAT family N-acetyltransferase [Candidatus Scalindua sp.]|nr:GNAT family N-acetyltransferase [Candidatus Scalindua sp.]